MDFSVIYLEYGSFFELVVYGGYVDCVKLFVKVGIDINIGDNEVMVVVCVVVNGYNVVIEVFYDFGLEKGVIIDVGNVFVIVVYFGYLDMVVFFVE